MAMWYNNQMFFSTIRSSSHVGMNGSSFSPFEEGKRMKLQETRMLKDHPENISKLRCKVIGLEHSTYKYNYE